jgi:hypothetical protein
VVTVTSMVPALAEGVVTLMAVSERTVKSVAATEPNRTAVAAVKPVPVMVVVSPPLVLPEVVVSPDTVGADGALNVKLIPLDVPPALPTVTLTVPEAAVGTVAVIQVSD